MKTYIVKSAKNNRELEDIVNDAIDNGYTPIGGIQNDGSYFHQAMIRFGKTLSDDPKLNSDQAEKNS